MMDTKLIEVAVHESESMIDQLMGVAERLERAIESKTHLRQMLKEAEQALETAEAEVLYEAEIAAQDKYGPLAGIAKTSAAYKVAITKLLADERKNAGPLGELTRQVSDLRVRLDQAQIEREQASVHFSACKHAAKYTQLCSNAANDPANSPDSISIAALLDLSDGYRYQSCECDDWPETKAARMLMVLKQHTAQQDSAAQSEDELGIKVAFDN
jgi:hypothetical protein